MDTPKTPEAILQEMGSIRAMERGRLCEMHPPSGRAYYKLHRSSGRRGENGVSASGSETWRRSRGMIGFGNWPTSMPARSRRGGGQPPRTWRRNSAFQ